MAHQSQYCLPLFYLLSNKLNSFCLFKTLIIVLVIYGDFAKFARGLNMAAATKNSTTSLSLVAAPHVVDDADSSVLTINNFNGNVFNRNQIIFDTLQPKVHDTGATNATDDNDLSSLSVGNCTSVTKTTTTTAICGTNTTSALLTSKIYTTKTQLAVVMPTGTTIRTHTVASAAKMSMSNVSSLLSASHTKSSSSSSFSSFSSTLKPSSPTSSSLLLLQQQQHLLSRPKRYLSFPEGSSFSVAVCFTVGIIGNPRYNYMSFGLNWGVAYDLPNTSWILNHLHGFAKRPIPVAVWHRRSRRSLYKQIENVVDNMGYNGRDCVLRALCESRQYFQKTKMSMIGEMMRALFSLPKQRIFTRELTENSDIELYDRAYRKARSIIDCSEVYDCGFSLLELAFGRYSTPPEGYYTKH